MLDINTVPLLIETTKGKKYNDIVALCINHDIRNDYLFGYYAGNMFSEVTYIAVPYNSNSDKTSDYRKLFSNCFHARKTENGYAIYHNEKLIKATAPDVVYVMDTMITLAIAQLIIPKIKEGKKLIILEDGGNYCSITNNLEEIFPELKGNVIGSIEQTTSGTAIAIKSKKNYPQISVARSKVKMNLESIFIGQAIISEISACLRFINEVLSYKKIIIIGYGIVGRSLRVPLNGYRCNIDVLDIDEKIRNVAIKDGFKAYSSLTESNFEKDTIMIGCTGKQSFTEEMLLSFINGKANKLFLFGASSKNFDFKYFIDLIDDKNSKFRINKTKTYTYADEYKIEYKGIEKNILLFGNGLPINLLRASEVPVIDGVMDSVFTEMADGAKLLVDKHDILDNKLYLLGSSDFILGREYEIGIIKKWFNINNLYFNEDADNLLGSHPETDYLRNKLISEQSNK